jgi:hypothetical protein
MIKWSKNRPSNEKFSPCRSPIQPFPYTNEEDDEIPESDLYTSPKLIMIFLHETAIEWYYSNYGIMFFYKEDYFL